MYVIAANAVIDGTPEEAWEVQVDVGTWPIWNSHEQAARLDGPFKVGTTGWSKPRGGPPANWVLTAVDPPQSWSSRTDLPGGALIGTRTFIATDDGRLACTYHMEASGPLEVVFRLWFGHKIRKDMITGFRELEAEMRRRRALRGKA